ncbi:MAG: hypothetical protein JST25_06805 [Actinobacteria bacterium]|nr:hypothetical protein [Actinomycetota bacterium]
MPPRLSEPVLPGGAGGPVRRDAGGDDPDPLDAAHEIGTGSQRADHVVVGQRADGGAQVGGIERITEQVAQGLRLRIQFGEKFHTSLSQEPPTFGYMIHYLWIASPMCRL